MQETPYGYCHCGCGRKTNLVSMTARSKGLVKGQPRKYLRGHAGAHQRPSGPRWVEEDRGYVTPCWIWQLALVNGYPHVWHEGRSQRAQRVIYRQEVGAIPAGFQIDHLCRVKACVNPSHFEAVTAMENTRRRPFTKLTPSAAMQIRLALLTTSLSQRSVADMFATSQSAVSQVGSGRIWQPPTVTVGRTRP